jgi:hypothetical protein
MIKVNNEEVKVESVENKVEITTDSRTEADGDNQYRTTVYTQYSFFADSTDEKDNNYYENILENEIFGTDKRHPGTALAYALEGEGWYIDAVIADQWMGVWVNNSQSEDTMNIECDLMEHGLVAAYLIAKQINEQSEKAKEDEK